jgi:serine protease
LLAAALALCALLIGWPGPAAAQRVPSAASLPLEDPSGARVIVKYKALGSLMHALRADARALARGPQMAATLGQRHGLSLTDGRAIGERSQVVHGDMRTTSAALAAQLAADPDVEYAVPDYRRHRLSAPNDALFPAQAPGSGVTPLAGQWYLQTPDPMTYISAIDVLPAWSVTTGSASVVIADIDTGVRFDHPDLTNKLLPGRNFFSTNGVSGQGWSADASDPGDYTTTNQCGSGQAAESSSWHGTQTAGILGAQTNNAIGMASVGYNTMVLPVRVLGACGGADSDIQAGMKWAGGIAVPGVPANPNPAKVINMSLGGSGSCGAAYADVISQLNAKGVVVVVAAGNDEGLQVEAPGNCPGAVAVAGLRNVGTKVGYSDIGPEVALSAPAGNCINTSGACLYPILTTTNAGTTTPGANTYTDGLNNPSLGTSFSTPLVAGTAALVMAANPSLTPTQVRSVLQGTSRPFPTRSAGATSAVPQCSVPTSTSPVQDECICTQSTCGAGMLDAGAAVASAALGAPPVVSVSAAPVLVAVGGSVVLTGTATPPAGDSIVSYQWQLVDGSAIAAFSGPTNARTATVVTSATGTFTATLLVTTSTGASASDNVSVPVNPPAVPAVRIVPSSSLVNAGDPVTLDGSGSTASSPATLVGYQWSIASLSTPGLATFTSATNAATATLSTLGSASGTVTVQLSVTDSFGTVGTASQSITVSPVAPLVSISPATTITNVGNSVSFDGSGSTPPAGRTIAGYQWTLAAGTTGAAFTSGTTGPTATVTASATGSYTVTLAVTDSAGARASRNQAVTVNVATAGSGSGDGGGGGGGGGAMSGLWLLGLAGACAALRPLRRRR